MAKKEWRLDSESKNLVAASIQHFLADRDPSVSAADWYKNDPSNMLGYDRNNHYVRLIQALPTLIVKDITYKVTEAAKASLASREAEVVKREATLKESVEADRKRGEALSERERELSEKVRDKEAALALGEAEMARMRAQVQAEMSIYSSRDFRTHGYGPMMMSQWGPIFARY